jgi:membrane-associated phospholipid phosphatase
MHDSAEFIARHAVSVLLLIAFVWLLITAAFWHVVHTYGTRLWTVAGRGWNWWRSIPLVQRVLHIPIAGPLFTRTMTVVRYLGLHAIVGFAIAIGAVTAFAELADEIGLDESLARFDAELATALGRHLSYETLRVFSVITVLGNRDVLFVLAALVSVGLLLWKRWVLAAAWMVATAAGGLMNLMLKDIFERPRPIHQHGLVTETSFSFPSGHASGSMLIYSLLGYLIVRHTPKVWHIPVTVAMVAVIIFVGSSRVLLQVHYFSDVLAGYASAAAWVALCIAGLEAVRWRGRGREASLSP